MALEHYGCFLEKQLADALDAACIQYVHESQTSGQSLDFYLPKYELHIEIKRFYTERISKQLESSDNIIVLQGRKSVELFIKMLKLK